MERVVGDVVDRADDPAVVANVEHVDARRRLLERPEVGAVARERVRDDDPVDAAVKDGQRGVPVPGEQPLQSRVDAVERLPQRFTAEEALRLVLDLERADERSLELVGWDRVEPAAAPFGQLRPELDVLSRRDDLGRFERARQVAGDDEVELDVRQRVALLKEQVAQKLRVSNPRYLAKYEA